MIFKIEEFSVFDGPGIRMTVFFKGCPLRCSWCHNPEGIRFERELMVSRTLCTHCGNCTTVCRRSGDCVACGACVSICPQQLRKITGEEWTPEELAVRILANRDVYESSGGGVTFSGGEPLAQPALLNAVLDRINGMHTAIETSGYAPEEVFRKAIQKLNLVIMDLKVIDPEIHRSFTGVDNALILRNLEILKASGKPFWIRIPLIPGVNDSWDNMEATAGLLKGAKNLERVELLPFNRSAGAKYAAVNRLFTPDFDVTAQPNVILEPFLQFGINGVVL